LLIFVVFVAGDRTTGLESAETEIFCFTRPSLYASATVPIPFSKKSRRNVVRQASENGAQIKRSTRAKLRPRVDRPRRSFLAEVLIPSLLVKRSRD
jgi:hypothetical protein